MIVSLKETCVKFHDKMRYIKYVNIHIMNIRSIHFLILGFLYQTPLHGYQIHKNLSDPMGVGAVWHIKITNIYGLLEVLEKQGYVQPSAFHDERDSYPPKKYFEITAGGKKLFLDWMKEPVQHGREIRQILLSKLYFAKKYDQTVYAQLIDDQIRECKTWLRNIGKVSREESEFNEIVNSFRTLQIESFITWLERWKK